MGYGGMLAWFFWVGNSSRAWLSRALCNGWLFHLETSFIPYKYFPEEKKTNLFVPAYT